MIKSYVKVNINDLKIWSKNPKKHREDLIEKSINELGYITPIVVDENNRILAGHGRYKALKKLGIKEVDVIKVEGLSEEQKEKFSLFDNKTTEAGGWDFDLLKNFDFDFLKDVGFDEVDLDEIFDLETTEDNFDVEKELEKIQEPKTKYGDLYQLGKHRLLCGDA
ncbi:MAG: ParB/Srx family N-terminal domain-containing protein, partial [Elusimicrobiales bacterium]|nr:ParB/Srx family N-terminal domain-containing protein [Elusimicrobiales bacterium]